MIDDVLGDTSVYPGGVHQVSTLTGAKYERAMAHLAKLESMRDRKEQPRTGVLWCGHSESSQYTDAGGVVCCKECK